MRKMIGGARVTSLHVSCEEEGMYTCLVRRKACNVIVDDDNRENMNLKKTVKKLKLPAEPRPLPYKVA